MCSPSTPDIPPAPKPPPPPEPTAEAPKIAEGGSRSSVKSQTVRSKRSGTGSLRIDLNVAQPGGQGLNIPNG